MQSITKIILLGIVLGCFFNPEAYASGFGFIGNWILKPLALSSCAAHLKPYVSKLKEHELCTCAWNDIIRTKGEASFVLRQVTQHGKDKKWQAIEKRQISNCVAATGETKTLTVAEDHNIKLAKWMNISAR